MLRVTAESLPGLLKDRAALTPDRIAFRFLADGTRDQEVAWTYRELQEHANAVAGRLLAEGQSGGRVVLALAPGLPYVAGLLGILQIGATVVPAFPPTNRRTADRLQSIVGDCSPGAILADARRADRMARFAAESPTLRWLYADDRVAEDAPLRVADPALLQYTSGSTGDPKGIALTHANLIGNCRVLSRHIGHEDDRVGLSWLPPYHDMGLIGTIMLALYGGWPLVMMSPEHFVQRPYRWLRAITDYRVTITVGPNFAFDHCAANLTDDEVNSVDLSSLRQVFCGSEPIFASTLDGFRDRFASRGYRETSLIPCYGLAEATLFVTGKPPGRPISVERVDRAALAQGDAVVWDAADDGEPVNVVGCGTVADGHELRVVDPASLRPLPEGRVGEVWVRGPNVAAGYHDRTSETERVFFARPAGLADEYLRTGDLGYLRGGELFVTGRIDDVIVIAGRNLYPQDVERTVNHVHPLVHRSAAFPVDRDAGDAVVVAVELRSGLGDPAARDEVRVRVLAAVAAEHGIRPADVDFVRAGTIPTTTSGKIRRSAARDSYLHRVPVRPAALGGVS